MQGGGAGPAQRGRELWPWLALLPLGFGSWAPLIAASRDRNPAYAAIGLGWLTVAIGGLLVAGAQHGHGTLGGYLALLSWVGGAISAFAVRSHQRRLRMEDDAIEPVSRPAGQQTSGARRRDLWPWVSLAPLGIGAWAPLIAGVRCRRLGWTLVGLAGVCMTAAGWTVAAANRSRTGGEIGGLLVCGGWIGGIVASFMIRPRYEWQRHAIPITPARWPKTTEQSRHWSVRYALGAFVATFAGVLALGLVLVDGLGIHIEVGLGVLIVDAALLLALVPLRRSRRLSAADLGLRPTLGLRSLGLVVTALLVYLVVTAVWVLIVQPPSTARAARDFVTSAHLSTLNIVLVVIALSASAPIVEEIFFRGLLYRSLRNRMPVLPAALLAGALFGLVHITGYPLDTLPIKAAFGVIACLLYERTGSLLPGIALHAFVDASVADAILTGNNTIVLLVSGAIIAILFARAGARRIADGRARRRAQPAVVAVPAGDALEPSTLTPP